MRLGVLLDHGMNISTLDREGQATRFVRSYLGAYAQVFDAVSFFSYSDEQPVLPAKVHTIPKPRRLRSILYALLLPFIRAREFRRCDVFRVMQMTGVLPAVIGKALFGTPFVATYGYRYRDFARLNAGKVRYFWIVLVERLGLQQASAIIVTTTELRDYVTRFTAPNRVHLVPNGVDVDHFSPAVTPKGFDPTSPVFAFVGRFGPQKNLPALIEAIAEFGRGRLLMVGDGEMRPRLEEQARRLGVAVEFLGTIDHDRLPAALRAADIFVLPSLIEGHPKALIEAMSLGLACIGTDVNGIRDCIVDGETGVLCPTTDAVALKAAIERVVTDAELRQRIAVNGRQYIVENLSINRLLADEIMILQRLARAKRR